MKVEYATIYAKVPLPVKRKIDAFKARNGFPSYSQTLSTMIQLVDKVDGYDEIKALLQEQNQILKALLDHEQETNRIILAEIGVKPVKTAEADPVK